MNADCPVGTETARYLYNPSVEEALKSEALESCQKHLVFVPSTLIFKAVLTANCPPKLCSAHETPTNLPGTL